MLGGIGAVVCEHAR